MKIKINGRTYTSLYKFDGGQYFTPDGAVAGDAWIALMDDGSLRMLTGGRHIDYNAEYTVIKEEQDEKRI